MVSNRSECPLNLAVEILGDRWSLLVLRDVMFAGRRHYRELLVGSDEQISTKLLADRLRTLMAAGLLTREADPTHRQKAIYSLTERSIALLPTLVHLGVWGHRELSASDELSRYAETLARGGQELSESFMDDLREAHLGPAARLRPKGAGPSFEQALQDYDAELSAQAGGS